MVVMLDRNHDEFGVFILSYHFKHSPVANRSRNAFSIAMPDRLESVVWIRLREYVLG